MVENDIAFVETKMTEPSEALWNWRTEKAKFTRKKNEFYNAIAKKESIGEIKSKFKELTEAWREVEGKHDVYVMLFDDDNAQDIEDIEIYSRWTIFSLLLKAVTSDSKENIPTAKLRKCEQHYVEVEIEWLRQIHSQYSEISIQVESRHCVKSIDYDLEDMWARP